MKFVLKHRLPWHTLDHLDWALAEYISKTYVEGQVKAGVRTMTPVRYMRPKRVAGGSLPRTRASRAQKRFLKETPRLSRFKLLFIRVNMIALVMLRNGALVKAPALPLGVDVCLRLGELVVRLSKTENMDMIDEQEESNRAFLQMFILSRPQANFFGVTAASRSNRCWPLRGRECLGRRVRRRRRPRPWPCVRADARGTKKLV